MLTRYQGHHHALATYGHPPDFWLAMAHDPLHYLD